MTAWMWGTAREMAMQVAVTGYPQGRISGFARAVLLLLKSDGRRE